ncbi:MAG TPA: N,N-dimethylformamidase beta subunit family domain-containing protein [Pirellulales bacterium]|nr:N,N-dimethylformamidase beta subunit family domain-containing protein [Pirellulales bacterium]
MRTLLSILFFLSISGPLVLGSVCTLSADEFQPEARSLYIEGYTDQLSYQPGETVGFHVSTTAPKWSLDISRLGAKNETLLTKSDLVGAAHAVPANASSHGCRWPVSYELKVPDNWHSGYYEVTLKASDNGGEFTGRGRRTAEAKLFFVVRPAKPGVKSKILLQLTTNTYNAYNNWGGHSLYAFHARSKLQGTRVSFDRPLAGFFRQWELPFVAWAERQGYTLDYAVNSDLEVRPAMLKAYKLVLSVGHDEYWSAPMRDHLEAFIQAGGNVAFFSGNTCCWQVRSEESGRALLCYKQAFVLDPLFPTKDHRLLATLWSHHLVARPENELTGVGFLYGGYHRSHGQFMEGEAAFTVHQPDHWLFAGTSLKRGDKFGGKNTIVGYECDGCQMEWDGGVPRPTHRDGTPESFVILGTCPARWHADDALWYDRFPRDADGAPITGAAVMGVYTRGGTVFTAGTTDWSHGLTGDDPIVEQITRNLLERLGK